MIKKQRCLWPNANPLMLEYHDKEWGVPVHNDIKLFEFLILEGAQAELAWETILRKREKYRKAFSDFDPAKISHYTEGDVWYICKYIWQFVGGKSILNEFRSLSEIPPKTKESDAMSKDLKKRGFKFVGSTICYAFMQAVGMVNDHTTDCFRYNEVSTLKNVKL